MAKSGAPATGERLVNYPAHSLSIRHHQLFTNCKLNCIQALFDIRNVEAISIRGCGHIPTSNPTNRMESEATTRSLITANKQFQGVSRMDLMLSNWPLLIIIVCVRVNEVRRQTGQKCQ